MGVQSYQPDYGPGQADPKRGPDGYLAVIRMIRAGFPDIQWRLKDVVAEGDTVAVRFMMRGTHLGHLFGFPPTAKTIQVQAMNFYR